MVKRSGKCEWMFERLCIMRLRSLSSSNLIGFFFSLSFCFRSPIAGGSVFVQFPFAAVWMSLLYQRAPYPPPFPKCSKFPIVHLPTICLITLAVDERFCAFPSSRPSFPQTTRAFAERNLVKTPLSLLPCSSSSKPSIICASVTLPCVFLST